MRYLYNPTSQTLDDTEDKNFGKKVEPKKNIKVASETPEEEADLQLGMEAIEVLKWLKKNPTKTYKDWLKDKKAILTDEQKKDPKIIDLEPYLPTFEDIIKKYEEEKKQEKEQTLEEFTNQKLKLMAEKDLNSGISSLVPLKRVSVSKGGLIKMSELNTKEKLEALKDVNRAHYEYRHKNQKGAYKKI
tara:strand:+ start:194 stop:757 length:564 start_codon:yes stop_codon:yes gene_type:complete